MLVDDDITQLELSQTFLERTGEIECDSAMTGEEALSKLASGTYDAIVSDYEMPGLSGIDLLKAVRRGDSGVPFIIYTGKGRESVVIEALNNNADFYLQKTGSGVEFEYADLANMVRQAVRRRRSELSVRKQEELYRELFTQMREGVCLGEVVTDGQGNASDILLQEINPAFTRLTGMSAELLTGKPVREVYPGMDPGMIRLLGNVAATGIPQVTDWYVPPLRRHLRVTAYRVESGKFATIFDDITEAGQLAEQIREQDMFLRKVLERTPITIFAMNLDTGAIRALNNRVPRLVGFTADELPGDLREIIALLVHPSDLPKVEAVLTRVPALPDGESLLLRCRLRHKDGSYRCTSIDFTVYTRNPDNTPREIVGIAWDIGEEIEAWFGKGVSDRDRLPEPAAPSRDGIEGASGRRQSRDPERTDF